MVSKLKQLYEGKAKILYETDDPDLLIQYFKDDASAFNKKKTGTIREKGVLNNKISSAVFAYLQEKGVKSHYVKRLSDREMLVKKVDIIPVEIVVRNVAAGSLSKRMGIDEGKELKNPILEYYYKDDALDDPMINSFHIREFNLAKDSEMEIINKNALRVNSLLCDFFYERDIRLIDFKLEYGIHKGNVLLADEITPDGCRLWDKDTDKKLDKDRFRRDMGDVVSAYNEVYKRVCL